VSHPAEVAVLSWTVEPAVIVPVVVAATLYVRGWATLARRMPERFGRGRLIAVMAGLGTVIVALSSPLDVLGHQLLLAHMIQHVLLMAVAPPLLWLGAPVAPMLLGLPRPIRRTVAIALAARPLRRLTHVLGDPRVGWIVFVIAFWAWHVPALYALGLGSDPWHHVQHACFFATALLFWRPVILPWPARSSWPRWAMIPYLALAELQNSTLAAILTFADHVIYPAYGAVPRRWDISALEDQSIAGVIMWVPGSLTFLLPILWLTVAAIATSASDRSEAPRLAVETRHQGHP
jgi:cytochrome c oxidase assembly factor CtaG